MHILHIASGNFFSTYGGGQVYVQNLCAAMVKLNGVRVSVFSFVDEPHTKLREHKGITIYEVAKWMDGKLAAIIKSISPDIIHAHSHKAQACRIGKELHIPVVATAHHGGIVCPAGILMNTKDEICQTTVCHKNCLKCCLRNTRTGLAWYPFVNLIPRKWYIAIGKALRKLPFIPFITPIGGTALSIKEKKREWEEIAKGCTMTIAPSDAIKEAMVRNGLDERKVRVVPHGIPLPHEVAPFTSTKDGVKFFYVGRICYVKGLHILLEAFHELSDKKAELHIIGCAVNNLDKRYEASLKKKYHSDSRIVWHGKVPPEAVYNTIKDFHISSSSSAYLEVFGLNIAESLAMGKPVLSTRNGGAEMQIEDGINGWLVPQNDVEAMRNKMEEIIVTPEERLGTMASSKPVVSIDGHCTTLLSIYKELTT